MFIRWLIDLLARLLGSYGRFERSRRVDAIFENGEVMPDTRYYIAGSPSDPQALLGLNVAWELESRWWSRFDATPERLLRLTQSIRLMPTVDLTDDPRVLGWWIRSPQGDMIGMFYGVNQTVAKIKGPRRINVYPPAMQDIQEGP